MSIAVTVRESVCC